MSTAQIWRTNSTSLEDTLALAGRIGQKMRGGEVIELVSDLGGGKTTFIRGLAAGMGSHDQVRSPSFTIVNQYRAANLTLYHLDFYRLRQPGIMREELAEIIADPKAVTAVEWGEIIEDTLPGERLTVRFTALGDTERQLVFLYPESLNYLLQDNT